jgi:hypothetical protein
VLIPLGAGSGLFVYYLLKQADSEGVNGQTLIGLPIAFGVLLGLMGLILVAIGYIVGPGRSWFDIQLDKARARFESGRVLDAAARLRKLRRLAEREGDADALADIDEMANAMRAHLGGEELVRFDQGLDAT